MSTIEGFHCSLIPRPPFWSGNKAMLHVAEFEWPLKCMWGEEALFRSGHGLNCAWCIGVLTLRMIYFLKHVRM